jgi:hypothetical protein
MFANIYKYICAVIFFFVEYVIYECGFNNNILINMYPYIHTLMHIMYMW